MPTFRLLKQVESDASGKETVFICNWITGATCLGKSRSATMRMICHFLRTRPSDTIHSWWPVGDSKIFVKFVNGNQLTASLWDDDEKYDWSTEGF